MITAYVHPDPNRIKKNNSSLSAESFEEISESDLVDLQAHRSPVSDNTDTMTYETLSSPNDGIITRDSTGDADIPVNQTESQKYVSEFLEKYVLGEY